MSRYYREGCSLGGKRETQVSRKIYRVKRRILIQYGYSLRMVLIVLRISLGLFARSPTKPLSKAQQEQKKRLSRNRVSHLSAKNIIVKETMGADIAYGMAAPKRAGMAAAESGTPIVSWRDFCKHKRRRRFFPSFTSCFMNVSSFDVKAAWGSTAILIMWGRPPACQLRCLWLRRELETSCASRSAFFPISCSKWDV